MRHGTTAGHAGQPLGTAERLGRSLQLVVGDVHVAVGDEGGRVPHHLRQHLAGDTSPQRPSGEGVAERPEVAVGDPRRLVRAAERPVQELDLLLFLGERASYRRLRTPGDLRVRTPTFLLDRKSTRLNSSH